VSDPFNGCLQCRTLYLSIERSKADLTRDAKRLAEMTDSARRKGHGTAGHLIGDIEVTRTRLANQRAAQTQHQAACPKWAARTG
jgi:hypothetical protein